MPNSDVRRALGTCEVELDQVEALVTASGPANPVGLYLTRYSIIRACGGIETAYKDLLADYCAKRSKRQVKRFLDRRVRETSANPTWDQICKLVKDFDEQWLAAFKTAINAHPRRDALRLSLKSLVDARNDFAHGGNPSASIGDVVRYFKDGKEVLLILDSVVG